MQLIDEIGVNRNAGTAPRIIPKRLGTSTAPLSLSQVQMWLMDRMTPGNPAYALPVAYRLKGPLDVAALEQSFNEIICRHAVLRTSFAVQDGEPRQVIHQISSITTRVTRLDHLMPEERERRLQALAREEARLSFDISQLPLMRVVLFKLDDAEHVLLINLHHILADGISLRLMLAELDKQYRAFTGSGNAPLPEMDIEYADFAAWQRESVAEKNFAPEIAFWRQELHAPLPVLELPPDLPRPAAQSFKGSNIFFDVPQSLAQKLTALGSREGCSPFTVLLGAFQILLHRYSGADDLVIGAPVSMRAPAEVEPLIGNFLNIIPLRCDLSGGPTFLHILRRTRRMTLRAFSKAALPFEKIVENLTFQRDPSRSPVFQVLFDVLPSMTPRIGELQVSSFDFDFGSAQFDLSFHAREEGRGYACRLEFCSDVFCADTIQRMSSSFLRLLSSLAANPDQRISEIPILTGPDKTRLREWNETARDYPIHSCLHHLFEAAAAGHPARLAVECGRQMLTYGELNERANQLANHLIHSGVKTEERVGICLDRSVDLVIALLGILKAGAAYVPLDPSFPAERLACMLQDAGISNVVTRSGLMEALLRENQKAIYLDKDSQAISEESPKTPAVALQASHLAYTIYTSGSSGGPKGVMIEHRSLVNCLCSMQREPGFGPEDVMVAVTTISFDIAALEIFLPLISGGKLVLANKDEARDGFMLAQLLRRSRATMLQATPATWRLLIDADWKAARKFKMLCGGEALPRELANQLLERGSELWNMYGPTETTIWSAVQRVQHATGPVLIGLPIANTQFHVVSDGLQPVPIGVTGELLIGGDGLARGYWNRPDLTAERFLESRPLESKTRVYRTGDMARFRADGALEFLGRRDFQVKIRGHRIELGEIEHALAQHEWVNEAMVIAWEHNDDKQLAAYYIPSPGGKADISSLREYLRRKLPDYMCPSFFIAMAVFPLTPNGKVDRKAFPAPDVSPADAGSDPARPQSQKEIQLAAIFQDVLQRRPVGLDDDFFALGGHSLVAARLFLQIEKKLGAKLPLATLLQAPTVRSLAAKIEESAKSFHWNSLVPIQPLGNKPPLFLVHGAEGNILLYRNLAGSLGTDQPVYGLQSQGLAGGELFEPKIESIAARYMEEIRAVQPSGPYYLGGYCLGGTIALEVGQQLRHAGEPVALVALLETYNVKSRPPASFALRMTHKAQNLYFQARNLLLSGGSARFLMEKSRTEFGRFSIHCRISWESFRDRFRSRPGSSYAHLRVKSTNHQAQDAYQPVPYDSRITLLKPRAHFHKFDDPAYGWGALAMPGMNIVEMPNYPRGSLNHPFVSVLACQLRREIEVALRDLDRRVEPAIQCTGASPRSGRNELAQHGSPG